jgi:hypothetical protein
MAVDLEILAVLDPADEYPLFRYFPPDVFEVSIDTRGGTWGDQVLLVRTSDYHLITNERLREELQKISVTNLNYRLPQMVKIINIGNDNDECVFPAVKDD